MCVSWLRDVCLFRSAIFRVTDLSHFYFVNHDSSSKLWNFWLKLFKIFENKLFLHHNFHTFTFYTSTCRSFFPPSPSVSLIAVGLMVFFKIPSKCSVCAHPNSHWLPLKLSSDFSQNWKGRLFLTCHISYKDTLQRNINEDLGRLDASVAYSRGFCKIWLVDFAQRLSETNFLLCNSVCLFFKGQIQVWLPWWSQWATGCRFNGPFDFIFKSLFVKMSAILSVVA